MAMTHDYLDYLNEKVGIAPAGSQEELQAANTIADLMRQHNVEPSIEEFDAKTYGGSINAFLYVAMFLGIFLGGIGVTVLTAIGFVLAVVPAALFILKYLGYDFISSLGPTTRSQNVVAFHKGEGPMVMKGTRPIVIVAHYDSPRENVLYSTPVAPYIPLLWRVSKWCVPAVAVCALFQIMAFLPEPFRRFMWIVGIVAGLPLVVLGVTRIMEQFADCTEGANDNKTGVASMLGVLDKVQPSGLESVHGSESIEEAVEAMREAAEAAAARAAEPEPYGYEDSFADFPEVDADPMQPGFAAAQPPAAGARRRFVQRVKTVKKPGKVYGTRHGADVLESLGMLPEGCEVDYVEPEPVIEKVELEPEPIPEPVAPTPQAPVNPMPAATAPIPVPVPSDEPAAYAAGAPAVDERFSAVPTEVAPAPVAPEAPVAAPAEAEPQAPQNDAEQTAVTAPAAATSSMNFDGLEDGVTLDPDHTGIVSEVEADATQPTAPVSRPKPAAPDDPDWGKTDFRPQGTDVARRATLFDLPDPSAASSDPFATDPTAPKLSSAQVVHTGATGKFATLTPEDSGVMAPVPAGSTVNDAASNVETDAEYEVIEDDEPAENPASAFVGKLKGLFAKVKDSIPAKGSGAADDAQDDSWSDEDDSWGDDDDSNGGWKGGAAARSGLRVVDGDEPADAPTDEDKVEAVLDMNDDALLCHDIWFVALGASDCDHAGMRAFLAEHRKEIRGSFVINLDSIGAGDLTLLSHEGLLITRRADRRLMRMMTTVASDLHIPVEKTKYDWSSTDATPSMLSSMRSITVMGTEASGMRALSHTAADVPENVVPAQAVAVTEAVAELIRRS